MLKKQISTRIPALAEYTPGNKQLAATRGGLLMAVAAILSLLWLVTGFTSADAAAAAEKIAETGSAPRMQAKHVALRDQLAANPFRRPLLIESTETSQDVKGEAYAVIASTFGSVSEALAGPQGWCDILILHLNTKYCQIQRAADGTRLMMNVGKKFDQPLEDSFRLDFAWQLAEKKANYLRVLMTSANGPLSTHDYRITLEAVPLANGKTFLHLSYSYGFGVSSKIAMQAYFATIGRDKVGFTVTGKATDGQPAYVDGMRGLVERNTMRYHLAIESYLGALALPEPAQFEKRINDWFNAVERYPRQLHEMDKAEYLEMKRKEYRRQQVGQIQGAAGPG